MRRDPDHPYARGDEAPKRFSDVKAERDVGKTRTFERVKELESAAAAAKKDGDEAMRLKLQLEAEEWRCQRYHDAPPPRKQTANIGGRQLVTGAKA